MAHRTAHAHAALALARGYDLAHPTTRAQLPDEGGEPFTDRQADTLRHVTADAYRALPHHQKIAIAATLFARLGTLPTTGEPAAAVETAHPAGPGSALLAGERRPAEVLSGLDDAVTSLAAARHRCLVSQGI